MKISKANLKDINFLFKIHNFYISKNLFSNKKIVLYNDHVNWFKNNYIKKKTNIIFIAWIENKRAGYVRLEKLNNKIFEVSFALNFELIGKGHGTKMLKKVLKIFLKKKHATLVSKVKKNNLISINCFRKNNFNKVKYNSRIFNFIKNHDNFVFFKYIDNEQTTVKQNL